MLLLCTMIMGIGSAWGADAPVYTLDGTVTGGTNAYAEASEISQNDMDWSVEGNTTTNPWRIGGKSLDKVDRLITGKTAFSTAINKITFNHAGTTSDNLIVNSVKLTVASDADFSTVIDEVTLTPTISKNTEGSFDFTPTSPLTEWTTGSYYMFTINISNSKSSNYGFCPTSIVFYAESSKTSTTTAIDATGLTNTNVFTSTSAGQLTATVTAGETTLPNAVITWTSSVPTVATVDESGNVTLVAAGTTTIKATYAGDENYLGSEATYELTVEYNDPSNLKATFDFSANKYQWTSTNNSSEYFDGSDYNATEGDITIGFSGKVRLWVSGGSYTMRFYSDDTYGRGQMILTAADGFVITGVSITGSTLSFQNPSSGTLNGGEWTGSAKVLTIEKGSSTSNFYKVDVMYTQDDGTPSITAEDVELAYDATEGSIAYTLSNGVEGGVLRATTTADWLTIGTVGETIPFTCDANTETTERTATVTLTYTYGNENVTKDVTVTQAAAPVVYATIPALFEAATSTATDVNVTFDSWVVSGVSTNGKNVFVTDGANGFVIFDSNGGLNNIYSVGSILSGTAVSCKLVLYNGFAEITNLNASDLTITAGGTVSEADIDMADLTGVNTGALVNYENLTCSVDNNKYYLSDGTTTLQVFNSLYAFEALEDGKTYNITGIYQQYNNTKEILPRSANDIVEVEVQHNPYTLTVSGLVNVNTYVFAGDESEMLFEGEGSAQIYDGTEVKISVDVEEGYVLQSLMVDGVEHKADIDEGMYIFTMPTNDVTVTATAAESATYTLATSITSGKHYIIVGQKDGTYKAMGTQNNNNRAAVEIDVDGETAYVTSAGVYEFVIYGPNADGYYTIYDEETGGYLYAAQGSGTGNYLRTEENLDSDGNGVWSITYDESGVATIKAVNGAITRNTIRYNSGSSLFSCYTGGQQDVYLFEKDGEAALTETVHITDAKYATYCSENALDFSNTGLTAYIAKMNGSIVSFEPVTKVPAYSGVLLQADAAGDVTVGVATTVDDVTDNAFIGVIEATKISEPGIFVLLNEEEGVGFYRTNNAFTVGAHTAYLPPLAGDSRNFIGLNETTGISDVNRETITNNRYFDLQGRRVLAPTKGLYIVNGKKVVVK